MSARFLLAVSLVLFPSFVRASEDFKAATPQELAMKDVAIAPGAPAVILDWMQRTDDVDFYSSEYVRIKVLTETGTEYANVGVPYFAPSYDFVHLKARVTKPDGTVVPFHGEVYDKVLVKSGGTRIVAKTFTLPDVRPGDIIEYTYDLVSRYRTFSDTYFPVQHELPVLHERLWLRPNMRTNYATFFTYGGLPEGKAPVKVGNHFELELENVAPFEREPFALPDAELKPSVHFYYAPGDRDVTRFWDAAARQYAEVIERFIGDRPAVRAAAQETVAGAATAEEKLKKLYARVHQVRNLAYEPERPAAREMSENKSVEDVLKNGYGLPSQINRLFVALARGAGFEANVVRVGERSERFLSKKIPVENQLDTEVAGVVVDGNVRFFDPGIPFAPFGMLSWEKTHVPGLKIDKSARNAVWLDIPEDSAEAAALRRTATLRLDGGLLKGEAVVTYSGHQAMALRREHFTHTDETARKSIEESVRGWFFNGSSVKLTKLTGLRGVEEPVVASFDVELPSTVTGSRVLLPLSVFSASQKNPFPAAKRKYDLYFETEYRIDDEVTLAVPPAYRVEVLPRPVRLDIGALTYRLTFQQPDGGGVRVTRNLSVRTETVDAEKYAPVREFFSQVVAADQEQLVLRKIE